MKKNNNRHKEYYVAVIKATNDILISTSKTDIADHLSINVKTVTRHLNDSSIYSNDKYILWSDVPTHSKRTGFALK